MSQVSTARSDTPDSFQPAALSGLRVIDLGHAIAGPFAATLLGDLGADVIKVERPGVGDPLRNMGLQRDGRAIWWKIAARNKRSITLNFTSTAGKEILRRLVAVSDVVVENFRPGTLERHGLGWDELRNVNPDLVMLRVSGYGQTGPKSHLPGFGRVAEAMSGAAHLTGSSEGPPVLVGYSLADELAGMTGALGVLAALHARGRTGRGDCIDMALYEPLFRLIDWQVPIYEQTGEVAERAGAQLPQALGNGLTGGMARSSDGAWMAFSAATDPVLVRLIELVMGKEALDDPRFASLSARRLHPEAVQDAVVEWVSSRSAVEVERAFEQSETVIARVFDVQDIIGDETFAARENIIRVADDDFGELSMPSVVPSLANSPGRVRWPGPRLGAQTNEVLGELCGLSDGEIAELRQEGVV